MPSQAHTNYKIIYQAISISLAAKRQTDYKDEQKKKNYIWIAKSKKTNPNDRGNLLAKSKLKSVKNSERTLQIPKISRKL